MEDMKSYKIVWFIMQRQYKIVKELEKKSLKGYSHSHLAHERNSTSLTLLKIKNVKLK